MINKILIWLALGVMVVSYNTWTFTINSPFHFLKDIYFEGMALSIFILSVVAYRMLKFVGTEIFVGLALNNLLDEMFFDPKKIDSNEYMIAALTIIFIIYKYKKLQIEKKYDGITAPIRGIKRG